MSDRLSDLPRRGFCAAATALALIGCGRKSNTAPAAPGTVTVTATSTADPTKSISLQFPVTTADIKGDGILDVTDMALLAATLGRKAADAGYCRGADLDGNGIIDEADILLFLKAF